MSICVVMLWIVVSAGTLKGVISGQMFHAPCLAELRPKEDEKDVGKVA